MFVICWGLFAKDHCQDYEDGYVLGIGIKRVNEDQTTKKDQDK